jgi:ribosomal protein S18 acetylase RimI-like enzyme
MLNTISFKAAVTSKVAAQIRPARMTDITAAHACLDSVARERRYLVALEAPPLGDSQKFWTSLIEQNFPFEVAALGRDVIGWCDITPNRHPTLRHSGTLGMGVLREYRRAGLGRRLLKAAIAHAREAGLERIELNVIANNRPAFELYRSEGFEVEGIRLRYRKLDGRYEDGIFMAILLRL